MIKHAQFIDIQKRDYCAKFSDVEFFAIRYKNLLKFSENEMSRLFDEFVDYQLMQLSDIPETIWQEASVRLDVTDELLHNDEEYGCSRMDVIWSYLFKLLTPDDLQWFKFLSKVVEIVLVLPHSNAAEERIFNYVQLNKTPQRNKLEYDGTLSSLLTIKLNDIEPCYGNEPTKELLQRTKSATSLYNKNHK